MKTKFAYFILGAIAASFAYMLGSLNNMSADEDVTIMESLIVDNIYVKSLMVVDENKESYILLEADNDRCGILIRRKENGIVKGTASILTFYDEENNRDSAAVILEAESKRKSISSFER